jgi:hypothetical protein
VVEDMVVEGTMVVTVGGARFGFYVGAPFYGLGYYPYYAPYYSNPAYGYPAPAYDYSAAAPAYVEQGNAMTAPPSAPVQSQGNWWYYCADSNAYYPYVRECPAGWQQVSPQPPSR